MSNKKLVISTCSRCPYHDNVYYTYSSECSILPEISGPLKGRMGRKVDRTEIPEDCPLEDTEEVRTSAKLGLGVDE